MDADNLGDEDIINSNKGIHETVDCRIKRIVLIGVEKDFFDFVKDEGKDF